MNRTMIAIDVSGPDTTVLSRTPGGEPVTATVPSVVRVGEQTIDDPSRLLGRVLVTVGDRDMDPVELVVSLIRKATAAVEAGDTAGLGGLVLVHPGDWSERAVTALRRAGELSGVPAQRIRTVVDGDVSSLAEALSHAEKEVQSPDNRPRRRILVGAVAVLTVLVVISGLLLTISRSGDGEGGDQAAARSNGGLDVLVGETGTFDCRTLYDAVPIRTLLAAGLVPGPDKNEGPVSTVATDGSTSCVIEYQGDRLPGIDEETPLRDHIAETTGENLDDFLPEGALILAPVAITVRAFPTESATIGEPAVGKDAGETVTHRNWTLSSRTIPAADGHRITVRAATVSVPGRGTFVFLVPVGADATFDTGTTPESLRPDAPDPLLSQVIDGFEDGALPAVASDGPTITDAGGSYDCNLLYSSVTTKNLTEHRIHVTGAATDWRIDSSGGHAPWPAGEDDGTGRHVCIAVPMAGPGALVPVQIVTGPPDGIPGNTVTGDDDFDAWEEYWAFSPVIAPADYQTEGYPSYNLRHCHSKEDCLTLITYADGDTSDTRTTRAAAMMMARYLTRADAVLEDAGTVSTSPEQ